MAYAVTHVLIAIILIDLFRKYVLKKKEFPLYLVLLGGIAGLLPDIDIIIFWILQTATDISLSAVHHPYTHNLIIPIIILLFAIITRKNSKLSHPAFVISAGYTIHIILDTIFSQIPIFYPLSNKILGLNLGLIFSLSGTFFIGLDAILLVSWLIYQWKTRNMRDYI
ncbi:MAG: metal-dependent hydrolase [Nanoarchaeota archaeon]|nr:metal-dependent hydrolase [Nanoarchaeota archaeon]